MKKTYQFPSHAEQLASVRTFVRQFLDSLPSIDVQEAELLVLGVDEACSNIIRHAYDEAGEGQPIILCCERSESAICFKLRDFGKRVDRSRLAGRPLEQVRPGGLGIFLMRHAFDEVDYLPQEIGTELVMTKRVVLGSPSAV